MIEQMTAPPSPQVVLAVYVLPWTGTVAWKADSFRRFPATLRRELPSRQRRSMIEHTTALPPSCACSLYTTMDVNQSSLALVGHMEGNFALAI